MLDRKKRAHRTLKIKQRKQEKEPVILLRNMKVFLAGEDKLRETKKAKALSAK